MLGPLVSPLEFAGWVVGVAVLVGLVYLVEAVA